MNSKRHHRRSAGGFLFLQPPVVGRQRTKLEGQGCLGGLNSAKLARFHHAQQILQRRLKAVLMPNRQHHSVGLAGFDFGERVAPGERQRLLAKNVLLRRGCGYHLLLVHGVGSTQDHPFDVWIGQGSRIIRRKLQALRPRPVPGRRNCVHHLHYTDF